MSTFAQDVAPSSTNHLTHSISCHLSFNNHYSHIFISPHTNPPFPLTLPQTKLAIRNAF